MAAGHAKERDSVFHVTCPYQPFWLHCIPLSCSPALLGPSIVSHPQSPLCFRIFAHSFPSLIPYSFFHYQINFNSSRKLSLISQISSHHLALCSLNTFIFYFRAFIPVCNSIFICDDLITIWFSHYRCHSIELFVMMEMFYTSKHLKCE